MTYTWDFHNRLNHYTIYKDGRAMEAEDVVRLLEDHGFEEPEHYAKDGFSPLESFRAGLISREELVGFCKGNIIKYVVRAGSKKGEPILKDYGKARDYLEILIDIAKE